LRAIIADPQRAVKVDNPRGISTGSLDARVKISSHVSAPSVKMVGKEAMIAIGGRVTDWSQESGQYFDAMLSDCQIHHRLKAWIITGNSEVDVDLLDAPERPLVKGLPNNALCEFESVWIVCWSVNGNPGT